MKGCFGRRCEANNPGLRSPESKHKDVSRPLCLKNTPTLHDSPRAGYQPGGTRAPFYPATAPNCQAPAANENKVHSQGLPKRAPAQTPRPGAGEQPPRGATPTHRAQDRVRPSRLRAGKRQ